MKNYYDILGVQRNATKDEIKKAFHKLAHKYHPDKKGGDEAKFKEINEAYQILSDEQKRAQYDNFGAAGGGPGGMGGFDFSGFQGAGAEGIHFDLGDIFGEFFGGNRGRARRGRDISVDIQIPFAEAIFGTERTVLINKVGTCEACSGSGAAPESKTKQCLTCQGRGRIRESRQTFFGAFNAERECPTCAGRGQIPETPCSICRGAGVRQKAEEVRIAIPAGIQDGEMIRMANQGEATQSGVAGDLYIRIHVERHTHLRRDGENLIMDLPIKLTTALLGADEQIKTLDGQLTLKIPAGISHGELLRVRGRGVPSRGGKRGDLLVRIVIKTPTKLSRKAKTLIENLKEEGL